MTLLEAIVLGLIQGLTEFIPISSSGHLVLAQYAFGHQPNHLFLEAINIGTVLALLLFFRRRITGIVRELVVDKNWRMARNVVISVLPAGTLGFFFSDFITYSPFFASPWVVAIMLFVVGIVLIALEKLPKATLLDTSEQLTVPRALAVGGAQALALIPGTSRSGATIVAGRLAGLKAATAAEYSFLISIPIMLGVIAKLLVSASDRIYLADNLLLLGAANLAAFVSGLLAVRFLMNYLSKHSLSVFGWYRVALAVVVVVVLLVQ